VRSLEKLAANLLLELDVLSFNFKNISVSQMFVVPITTNIEINHLVLLKQTIQCAVIYARDDVMTLIAI